MDYNHDGKRAVVWKRVRPPGLFRRAEWAVLAQDSFNTKAEAERWSDKLVSEDARKGRTDTVYYDANGGQDCGW